MLVASCSDDDAGQGPPEGSSTTVEPVTGLRDLVSALQDERSAAFVTITGVSGVTDGATGDADVRRATDQTLADLDAAAIGALDGLTRLRSDVDARPLPADLTQVPFANEIFDRYSELIAGVLGADANDALEIAEPEARRGAELLSTGLRQTEVVAQLIKTLVVGVVTTTRATRTGSPSSPRSVPSSPTIKPPSTTLPWTAPTNQPSISCQPTWRKPGPWRGFPTRSTAPHPTLPASSTRSTSLRATTGSPSSAGSRTSRPVSTRSHISPDHPSYSSQARRGATPRSAASNACFAVAHRPGSHSS
jgi:Nitrate and nitrite sensing